MNKADIVALDAEADALKRYQVNTAAELDTRPAAVHERVLWGGL